MSQAAMDAGAFAEMKEMMGDSFTEIITLCLETLPEQNSLLKSAVADEDAEQIFSVAHRIKSSCGSIGAFGLAEKVEVIELIGRQGSTQGASDAYAALQPSLEEVLSVLKNELG